MLSTLLGNKYDITFETIRTIQKARTGKKLRKFEELIGKGEIQTFNQAKQ
jgi:hypothetical protein